MILMHRYREQSDDLSSETEIHSLPPDSLAPDGILAERFSPDKMPQLTQDQQKALSGGLHHSFLNLTLSHRIAPP